MLRDRGGGGHPVLSAGSERHRQHRGHVPDDGVALPAFLLAMYEKDGLPFEKVVRNILRARFLRPGVRPYQTENIYAPFTQRGAVRKEDAIAKSKQPKARPRKGR